MTVQGGELTLSVVAFNRRRDEVGNEHDLANDLGTTIHFIRKFKRKHGLGGFHVADVPVTAEHSLRYRAPGIMSEDKISGLYDGRLYEDVVLRNTMAS